MQRKGMRELRKNSRQGVSLVIVLCVSAFFVAFAAAILYTAGLLTSQSTGRLKEERSYLLAQSFAEALDKELSDPDASFFEFVNRFLDGNQYAEDTPYSFMPEGTDLKNLYAGSAKSLEGYGNLRVTLTKEINESESSVSLGGTIPATGAGNYGTTIAELERMTVRRYLVIVDVTSYYDDITYTYSTEYTREQKYALNFWQGEQKLVWEEQKWHKDTSVGDVYDPDPTQDIRYEYDASNVTECKFVENTYTDMETTDTEPPDPEGGETNGTD